MSNDLFPVPETYARSAHCDEAEYREMYARSIADPEGFWAEQAARKLHWFKKWDRVLDWKPPHAKWFVGGTLNASVNCVDRHARGPRT